MHLGALEHIHEEKGSLKRAVPINLEGTGKEEGEPSVTRGLYSGTHAKENASLESLAA